MDLDQVMSLKCPEFLKDLRGWVVCLGKVPYYTNGGIRHMKHGEEADRKKMATFDEAKAHLAKMGSERTGLGFVFRPEFNITCLDFDKCVHPQLGTVDGTVLSAIEGTYAEFSPSGTGVHAFVLGSLGDGNSKVDGSFGLDIFSSNRFVTFTGNAINKLPIATPNSVATRIIAERFPPKVVKEIPRLDLGPRMSLEEVTEHVFKITIKEGDYKKWLDVGMALHYETEGSDAGLVLWNEWSLGLPRYQGFKDLEIRWRGFNSDRPGGVTGATLAKYAREANDAQILNDGFWDSTVGDTNRNLPDSEAPSSSSAAEVQVEEKVKKKTRILTEEEFLEGSRGMTWLVKGLLPRKALTFLYGSPGSGKTFIALDMCCAIADGRPWNNKKTTTAPILYVVAEGAEGLRMRVKAHRQVQPRSTGGASISFINHNVPNLLSEDSMRELALDIEEQKIDYGLIVIDTMAQTVMGGDENSANDMGAVAQKCTNLANRTGATVLLIHHTGKDEAKGMRGSTALKGAADTVLRVTNNDGYRNVSVEKQKDGDTEFSQGFRLKVLTLNEIDDEGEPVTSCVVEYGEFEAPEKDKGLSDLETRIYALFLEDKTGVHNTKELHNSISDAHLELSGNKLPPSKSQRILDKLLRKKLIEEKDGGYKYVSN